MSGLYPKVLLLIALAGNCYAQDSDIRYYVDCERGVSFVSNAAHSHDGRAIVVGDLGRLGVIGPNERDFTWHCLPEQPFLFDGWLENDSIVVVGEKGSVWWRVERGVWRYAGIPSSETCRTIARRGSTFYVGTEQGSIWACSDLATSDWKLQTVMPSSILDMYADDTTLVAVGGLQGLYEWSTNQQGWIDLSNHADSSQYSAVHAFHGFYIIGADSGQLVRYERSTQQQLVSQLFTPSTTEPFPDFRGRNDRTLSICETLGHELLVTGNYREGASTTTGIYLSSDSGTTWKRRPFYDDSTTFEWFSTEYCPLVMHYDSITTAIVASAGSPIVMYRSSDNGKAWSKDQSTSMYQLLTNTSNSPDSTWHTYVDVVSGLTVDENRQALLTISYSVPQNSDDYQYPYTRTFVVRRSISESATVADTLSIIDGKYRDLQRNGDQLLMSGDSLRQAVSDDGGKTWTVSRIDPRRSTFSTATQIVLKGGKVAYAGNNGFVYLDDNRTWDVLRPRTDSFARPVVVNAVRFSENSALVEVDYYQMSTLLYRTIQMLTINGSSYTIDSLARIPERSYNAPALYADNDTVVMLMPTRQFTPKPASLQLRCVLIGSEWRCDTMFIELDNGSRVPFGGSDPLVIYTSGAVVVCQVFSGAQLYSVDHCRTWKVLPYVRTMFSGPMWATALAGETLFVAGYQYMIASITLPTVTSTLDEEVEGQTDTELASLSETMTEFPQAVVQLSSILGIQLNESPISTVAQLHDRCALLSNGAYLVSIVANDLRRECVVLVVDGKLYACTKLLTSSTK